MPYNSLSDLPESVKKLPSHAQEIFKSSFNNAWKEYGGDESKCFGTAWSAVEKQGYSPAGKKSSLHRLTIAGEDPKEIQRREEEYKKNFPQLFDPKPGQAPTDKDYKKKYPHLFGHVEAYLAGEETEAGIETESMDMISPQTIMPAIWGETMIRNQNPRAWIPDTNSYIRGLVEYKRGLHIPGYEPGGEKLPEGYKEKKSSISHILDYLASK